MHKYQQVKSGVAAWHQIGREYGGECGSLYGSFNPLTSAASITRLPGIMTWVLFSAVGISNVQFRVKVEFKFTYPVNGYGELLESLHMELPRFSFFQSCAVHVVYQSLHEDWN